MTRVPDGKPTPAQLRAEYERGASIQALSVRHRMSTGTVANRLRTAGTVVRPSSVASGVDRAECNRLVLSALARQSSQELFCADIAEQLGMGYHVIYKTLQRLVSHGLITSPDPDLCDNRGRRPYRLTEVGMMQVHSDRADSGTAPEPLITGITAQILLALLQHPIRSWRAADLANRVRCQLNTVIRFAAAMEPAGWATTGWATTGRSTTEHNGQRVDITLTDHGVNHARAALRREYGDYPALIVLANAMHPPVKPIEV